VQSSFAFFGVSPERRERCLAHLRVLAGVPQSGAEGSEEVTIAVTEEQDLVRARLAGKAFCQKLGFNDIDATKVMTAIAELARNIFKYAGRGEIRIFRADTANRAGVQVIASDHGPGIPDVSRVLRPDFRSKTGMGRGLQGTRALMDFFEIHSSPGGGTTVTIRKSKS
jgi:serine/threonine-protein kinase RsbT